MLNDLRRVNWPVLLRTYGSFHQTLIGLIASWWNTLGNTNSVLDGPPACATAGGRKHADLILCTRHGPVVVVEAEGTKYENKLHAIAGYLDSDDPCLQPLTHGFLLAYPTSACWRGPARHSQPVPTDDLIQGCKTITRKRRAKSIILVTIGKRYERVKEGIRSRSEYYYGTVSSVCGYEFSGGDVVGPKELLGEA
jgi:hypothetical protein